MVYPIEYSQVAIDENDREFHRAAWIIDDNNFDHKKYDSTTEEMNEFIFDEVRRDLGDTPIKNYKNAVEILYKIHNSLYSGKIYNDDFRNTRMLLWGILIALDCCERASKVIVPSKIVMLLKQIDYEYVIILLKFKKELVRYGVLKDGKFSYATYSKIRAGVYFFPWIGVRKRIIENLQKNENSRNIPEFVEWTKILTCEMVSNPSPPRQVIAPVFVPTPSAFSNLQVYSFDINENYSEELEKINSKAFAYGSKFE